MKGQSDITAAVIFLVVQLSNIASSLDEVDILRMCQMGQHSLVSCTISMVSGWLVDDAALLVDQRAHSPSYNCTGESRRHGGT